MYRLGQSLHACKQISLTSLLFLNHEGFFFFFFLVFDSLFPLDASQKKTPFVHIQASPCIAILTICKINQGETWDSYDETKL